MYKAITRGLVLGGLVVAYLFGAVVGCSKDCEKPRMVRTETGREVPAITCYVPIRCFEKGKGDVDETIKPPFLVKDWGQGREQKERCAKVAEDQGKIPYNCKIIDVDDIDWKRECLDVKSGNDDGGPLIPTGGTIVTVGVGASSGDFPQAQTGGEGGASAGEGQDEYGDL